MTTIAEKILYRIGMGMGLCTDFRTDSISFDRSSRDRMNHLVSLYEALDEVGFDLSQPITALYQKKFAINKKCSTERLIRKIKRLTALDLEEKRLIRKREIFCLVPKEVENDFLEEHLQQLFVAISNE